MAFFAQKIIRNVIACDIRLGIRCILRRRAFASDPTNSTDLAPERRLVISAPALHTNSVEEHSLPTPGAWR